MTPDKIAALRAGGHSVLAHKYNDLDSCPTCHADKREEACGEDHIIGTKPETCFACLSEQRDELLAALKGVAKTDDDCPVCDRGRLRNPQRTHWPECPFGRALDAIAKAEGGRTAAR